MLWWCMWAGGSVFWLVVIIQIVLANSETGIIKPDSNKTATILIQEPSVSENSPGNPSNATDSILPADNEKPESIQQDGSDSKETVNNKDACINVNTAAVDELVSLQGIGPVLAQRIVEFRKENGDFRNASDLVKVKGIGEGKLKKIKDHICF